MFQLTQFSQNEDDLNLNEICRLCRNSRGVMSYIFSPSGDDNNSLLSERITNLVNVDIQEGDGLPSLICHRCLYHLELIMEFKIQCEQSDSLLRQYVACHVEEMSGCGTDEDYHTNHVNCQYDNDEGVDRAIVENNEEANDSDDRGMYCYVCNKSFDSQEKLDRHVHIHNQDGPFNCDYCEETLPDKASLKIHWKQEHAGDNANMCQTCGAAYKRKDELMKHNIKHDKMKPYRCKEPSCKKAFSYQSDLRKHAVIHTGLRPYVCPICYKSFTRSTNLNKHARVHTGRKPFSCGDCDKMFATRGDLLRHSLIHTGEKPYACSICFVSFNRKDKLTRHEKLHIETRLHNCTECQASFARKEELTKHLKFQHLSPASCYQEDSLAVQMLERRPNITLVKLNGEEHTKDERQPKEMNTEREVNGHSQAEAEDQPNDLTMPPKEDGLLRNNKAEDLKPNIEQPEWSLLIKTEDNHIENNELDINPNKLKIQKIDEEPIDDNSQGMMNLDENSEENVMINGTAKNCGRVTEDVVISVDPFELAEPKLQCSLCDRCYKTTEELTKHKLYHEKTRDFVCEICSKGFHQRRELVRHSLTHSGDRPFACETCGKAFARRDKLTRHMKTHVRARKGRNLGDQPPTCEICFKVYSSQHELSRHTLTHSICKPYQCSICTSSYCRKDKLVKHIKTVHSHPDKWNSIIQRLY